MSIDRLPPQSIEAEQSVLGALLIDRDAVIEVAEVLRPEDFVEVPFRLCLQEPTPFRFFVNVVGEAH